jgi:cyclopropane fatty-acyl-phospholipid synthase-like methyltransferase
MLTDFLDSVKAFALARVLMAAIELDLFKQLEQAPLSRAELKERTAIEDTPISDAVLDVLVAFQILSEDDGRLELSDLGRSILPMYQSIKSWNREMQLFYDSLCDLTRLLRSGRYQDSALSGYWAYKKFPEPKQLQGSAVDDYSSVMDASQAQLSQAIVGHYDFGAHEHIIDFGGGHARLAITLAEKHPHLKITIADLPAVCEGARACIDAAGLGARIKLLPVDFFRDELPANAADAILFVRVLHDWNDEEVSNLVTRTRSCLRSPGTALVVEPMNDDTLKHDPSSVLTSLMITLFGGRRRSVQEYAALMRSAGYTQLSWRDCELSLYRIIVAHIPRDNG